MACEGSGWEGESSAIGGSEVKIFSSQVLSTVRAGGGLVGAANPLSFDTNFPTGRNPLRPLYGNFALPEVLNGRF